MSKNVTIYTRKFCGFCTAARRLLESKGIKFIEHDGTFDTDIRHEMVQLSGGRTTFPQIFIGDVHVGGCDDLMALEQQGKLDPLLGSVSGSGA